MKQLQARITSGILIMLSLSSEDTGIAVPRMLTSQPLAKFPFSRLGLYLIFLLFLGLCREGEMSREHFHLAFWERPVVPGWEPGKPSLAGHSSPVGLWANHFTSLVLQSKIGNLPTLPSPGTEGSRKPKRKAFQS